MLIKHNVLEGEQVRAVVNDLANSEDLQRRDADKSDFL